MGIHSPYPKIDIPQTDILTYLFGSGESVTDTPLWINAADTNIFLSSRGGLQWIKRVGIGLNKIGVKRGEVVLHISPNHIFTAIAYLGTVGAGRIFSGANPMYTADEMAFQMKDTGARIVLVHPALLKTARKAARIAGNISESQLYLFSDTANSPTDGIEDWRSMLGSPSEADEYKWQQLSASRSLKQIATVNYSSGTTGLPKGVMITHANLIANAEQSIFLKFAHDPSRRHKPSSERWVGFLPLFHAFGQLYTILLAMKLAIPVFVMSTFDFEKLLQIVQDQKITQMAVAPPIMVLFSKHPATKNYNLSSLQKIICGAAPLSQSLQNECTAKFNITIGQGWGMTELTCAGSTVPEGSNDTTGSVGALMPGSEAKLVDSDGNEVATGERGEIYIRGPNVTTGYWRNRKATQDLFTEDGWLKTGDVAVCNDKGWIWIVDRAKELIKVSGLQVAPAELEALLLTHPAIADAGVVGVQEGFGTKERVRAYVVRRKDGERVSESEVQEWMRERVARYKWLSGGVVFVGEIPKSAAGKIQRKVLRELAKRGGGEGKVRL